MFTQKMHTTETGENYVVIPEPIARDIQQMLRQFGRCPDKGGLDDSKVVARIEKMRKYLTPGSGEPYCVQN